MAKVLVHKRGKATLSGSHVCVSVMGDGVQLWAKTALVRSYPLGSSAVSLIGAALCEAAGMLVVAMSDARTKQHFLVSCDSRLPPLSTLAEASPRVGLPGPVHSIHTLSPYRGLECTVVVLENGDLAWAPSSLQDMAPLQLIAAPVGAGSKPEAGAKSSTKLRASASDLNQLAVLSTSTTGSVTVHLYLWQGTGLTLADSIAVKRPSGSPSAATDVRLAQMYALVTWSSGIVSILKLGAPAAAEGSQVDVDASDADAEVASKPSSASSLSTEGGKKRRQTSDHKLHPQSQGATLAAPIDGTQFIIASITASSISASGFDLQYRLVDSQFGCGISHGNVPLEGVPASTDDGAVPPRLHSSPSDPAGRLILELEGAILSVQLKVPQASLLSLVGRLSLGPSSSGGKGRQQAPELPQGSLCSFDIKALSPSAAGSSSLPVPLLTPLTASSLPPLTSVRPVFEKHAELLSELEQLDSNNLAPASISNASRTSQRTSRQDLLKSALKSLLSPTPPGEAAAQPPPLRLVVLLAQRLAEAGQWDGLGQLLESSTAIIPAAGPTGGLPNECSWLLLAAAKAQQYRLLAPLCVRLEELTPAVVVKTISVILTPSTGSDSGPRKAHYAFVRAHAEAAIAHSEGRSQNAVRSRDRRSAVALAHCAAAVVDGFSHTEVLLHPLLAVPMDSPALQVCLSRLLSNLQVDRLLTYLAKWMEKYTQKLGEHASSVLLPKELFFPTLSQVVEWVRMLLDAHLNRLIMAKEPLPCLDRLLESLTQQITACQHLLPLLGCAEHIQQRALLPAAHVAAATQYTVELLDLSVKAN